MGLFVADDGRYQGWLAAFLCCCAAVDDDESPAERRLDRERQRENDAGRAHLSYSQPMSPVGLLTAPSAVHLLSNSDTIQEAEAISKLSSRSLSPRLHRPSSMQPSGLGEDPSFEQQRSSPHSRRISLPRHDKRPSISTPSAFRRLDLSSEQRQSLVPLRLGPVVLRDSPSIVPERSTTSTTMARPPPTSLTFCPPLLMDWKDTASLDQATSSESIQSHSNQSSPTRHRSPRRTVDNSNSPAEDRQSIKTPLSTRSSASSIARHGRDTSISSMASRTSSERLRPRRKKSYQSFRRHDEDEDMDLEKEIIELNTIVEERRTESARVITPDDHIPAIAPAMQIRARSETLDAIGSALSRPQTARDGASSREAPWDPSPPLPSRQPVRRATSRTRVAGWLSGLLPSISSTLPTSHPEPFYRCQATQTQLYRHSEASFTTILDSPSLTAASSPTTRGHSRSHTGDSYMVPPPATSFHYRMVDGTDGRKILAPLPSPSSIPSQVGLAL